MTAVEVFIDAAGAPRLVGQARVARARGRVSTTFLYDPAYLADGGANLDPALLLAPGAQHQDGLVRAFADSAPDRWGRNLIRKAERSRAREEGRVPRRLDDLDFLLGAGDDTRQGALRFRLLGHDEFLGEPSRIPRLIALPELLRAGASWPPTTTPRTLSSGFWTRGRPDWAAPGPRPRCGSTTAASRSPSSRTPETRGT